MSQEQNILMLLNGTTPFYQYYAGYVKSLFSYCVSYCKLFDIYNNTREAYQTLKYYIGGGFEQHTDIELDKQADEIFGKIYAGFYWDTEDCNLNSNFKSMLEVSNSEYSVSKKSWEYFRSSIEEYEKIKTTYENKYATITNSLMEESILRVLNDEIIENLKYLYNCQSSITEIRLWYTIRQIQYLLIKGKLSEYSSPSNRKKQIFKLRCGKNLSQLENYITNLDFLLELYNECNAIFQENIEKA